VKLSALIEPLKLDFEALVRETFSDIDNKQFLENVEVFVTNVLCSFLSMKHCLMYHIFVLASSHFISIEHMCVLVITVYVKCRHVTNVFICCFRFVLSVNRGLRCFNL